MPAGAPTFGTRKLLREMPHDYVHGGRGTSCGYVYELVVETFRLLSVEKFVGVARNIKKSPGQFKFDLGGSMKGLVIVCLVAILSGCGVRAKSIVDRRGTIYPPNNGGICSLAGSPPSDIKYEVVGRVVATKKSYGSSDELLPAMAYEARKLGADAIINLQAGQRFKGPLPWRITSPTGDGTAIKVLGDSPPFNCSHAGGRSL
jgi:hypothetical protein